MMDKIVYLSSSEREELFNETAIAKKVTPAVIEKDFWVTWILYRIFNHSELSKILIFKGGTSLSKVYKIIERFSEDIDLILDWSLLTDENPKSERSRRQQEKLNKEINEKAKEFIAGKLLNMIKEALNGVCDVKVDETDPYVINVIYPLSFRLDYLRPVIRLEIGPLAEWMPNEKHFITSYCAEVFPETFEISGCNVPTILAERTFWEKATILHHEAHRPEQNPQPPRYSRHYYDLAMMAKSDIKPKALKRLDLLGNVVEFKKRFYYRGWAKYDEAKPGTFKLIPPLHIEKQLRTDYKAMKNMIFGYYPSFDEIIHILKELEDEINQLE